MDLKLFFLNLILVVEFSQTLPNREYIEDETAEIAVPRSPRIHGPLIEYIEFPFGYQLHNLTCEIAEGIPTPKIIWIKDHLGIQPPLREEFDADKKTSTLFFPQKNLASSTTSTPAPDNQKANTSSMGPRNHQHYPDSSLSNIPGVKVHAIYANPENTPPPNKTYTNWNGTWEGNYTCVAANFLGRATKTYIISFSKEIPTTLVETTLPSLQLEETTPDYMAIQTTLLYVDDGEKMTTTFPDIPDRKIVFPYGNGNVKARVAYLTKLNLTGRHTLLAVPNGNIKNHHKLPSAPSPTNYVMESPPNFSTVELHPTNLRTELASETSDKSNDPKNVPVPREGKTSATDSGTIPDTGMKNTPAVATMTEETTDKLSDSVPKVTPLKNFETKVTEKAPPKYPSTTATESISPKYPGSSVERVMTNYRIPNIAAYVTENDSTKSPPPQLLALRKARTSSEYPTPELATSMKDAVPPEYPTIDAKMTTEQISRTAPPPSHTTTVHQLSVQPIRQFAENTDQRPETYNQSMPSNSKNKMTSPHSLNASLPVVSNPTTKTIDTEEYTVLVANNSTTKSGSGTTRVKRSHRRF